MPSIRDRMKAKLADRVKKSYNRRQGQNKSYFKSDIDATFWKVSEDDHIIDIIPYFAGNFDPLTKPGEPTYGLEIYAHQGVGPDERAVVCMLENYGKPCPICEHRQELRSQYPDDKDMWKHLYPKRRMVYNIICYDSAKEEEKGIQVWEVAWWFSERHFSQLARTGKRPGYGSVTYTPFADPDEGKMISFSREGQGAQNTQFLAHKFIDREVPISEEILAQALVLDELLYIPTYEEVYSMYYQTEFEGDSSQSKTSKSEPDKPHSDDSATEPVSTPRQDNKAMPPSRSESSQSELKSVKQRTKRTVESKRDKQDKQTDVSESDQSPAKPTCPGGGEFGVHTDELDACEQCALWSDCAKANDQAA